MKNTVYPGVRFSSSSPFHRLLIYVLSFANLLSIVYLLILGYYNRLAMDDYCYLTIRNEHGFFSPFTFWYQNYQGRFAPQFFFNMIAKVFDLTHSLLPFTILFLTLFIWVLYKLLKKIVPVLSNFELLNLGAFVFSVFVINNYEFNTFFWLNVSAMYFGGVLFLLIGINEILSSKSNFRTYLLIIFCGVYVGSSSETFALIMSILTALALIIFLLRLKFDYIRFISDIHLRKLLLAFIFCSVSFMIMYLAPGNDVRLKITAINMQQQIPMPLHKFLPAALNAFLVFSGSTILKLPVWVLLSLPFLYLGVYLKDNILFFNKVDYLKILPFCFVIFLWICLLPTVYVQGDIGPGRALTHIAFYMTCFVAFISLLSGLKLKLNKNYFLWMAMMSLSFWIYIIIGRLINEVPDVKRYAYSEDIRVALLKKFENRSLDGTLVTTYKNSQVSTYMRDHLKLLAGDDLNNFIGNNVLHDTLSLAPLYLPVATDVSEQLRLLAQNALNSHNLNNSKLSILLGHRYTHYILMPNEIRPAPQDFVNDCICDCLHLGFHLKLKN